ncbi:MAG: GntP family permease, partial [Holophagales bacterium]|nr:GntP family permease [Holophagales bacterium]
VAVAGIVGADLGWVIAFGLASGIPALLVGAAFGAGIARRLGAREAPPIDADVERPTGKAVKPPALATSSAVIALPLAAILAATASRVWLPETSGLRAVLQLVGHPFTALLGSCLLAYVFLGARRGLGSRELRALGERSLEPVGMIVLVTGAGGALGKVFVAIGVGEAVSAAVAATGLPLVLLAFTLAAAVRVAQGSATVSMVTAAGLVAPVVDATSVGGPDLAAIVIAIAAGATVLSHVNDSGFWLVSRYLGLSERETLRSWTLLTTVVGGTGFVVAWALSTLV